MSVTISLQLNTARDQHRIIQITEKILSQYNEKQLMKHLIKITKGKFKLKKNSPKRFFVLQTAEEVSLSNINMIISSHYASTLKNGLSLLVSFGEDYIGKIINHPFKRQNKQQMLLSILINYNISNHYIDTLRDMTHLILSYLPKPIKLPLMRQETQNILRHILKIMSSYDKKQNNGFNDIYRECTRSIYCALRDECINNNNAVPPGLNIKYNKNIELILSAQKEVDHIFEMLLMIKPTLKKSANLKFYINTAYYSRWESDPWPMFTINDKRVHSIMKCVDIAYKLFNIKRDGIETDKKLLNIIIRQYRNGDVLGFHTDRNEFVEPICGIVLKNNYSDKHSLIFYKEGIKPFIAREKEGLCWCLRDEARWEYKHGLCAPFSDNKQSKKGKRHKKTIPKLYNQHDKEKEIVRTSISFRWFQEDATLPSYNHDNDL